jgi:outer membrane protein assembly factor BamB
MRLKGNSIRNLWVTGLAAITLVSCSDAKVAAPKDEDKRLSVMAEDALLTPSINASSVIADIPDQTKNTDWLSVNDAMQSGHLGITGVNHHESTRIGHGEAYGQGLVPLPIVRGNTVYAMDGVGTISAHDAEKIGTQRWQSDVMVEPDAPMVMGGGLAIDDATLYATTGYGALAALDITTGQQKWKITVGVPIRSAPQVASGIVVVVTVDNQTLAFKASDGKAMWTHRGIHETAGYVSAVSPVISGDAVLAAYSSGEITALRLTTGEPLWTDGLVSRENTHASDVFTGIDADPVIKDSIVYAVSTSGIMVADALLNGRTLWQQKISSHATPWVVGNMIYLLTDKHQLLALSREAGAVVWTQNLGQSDDKKRDITPLLYGPIVAGNAVLVFSADGILHTFRPRDGKALGDYDVAKSIAAPPVIAGGTLYVVTRDATLVAYR